MKFCPKCGVKFDNDNFKFCHGCGYKFGSDTINSNQCEKSEPKGFIDGFINGIRNQIPEDYVEKIKNNETIDDAVTHAKIIWHGPKTEKEKAYRDRKNKGPNSYGSKSKHGYSSKTCTVCGGTGQIKVINNTFLGQVVNVKPCKECGGTGKIITECADDEYGKFSKRKK